MLEHIHFGNTTFSTRERQVPQNTVLSTGISTPDPWSELLSLWTLGLHTVCNTELICTYLFLLFLTDTDTVVSDIPPIQKGSSKENIPRGTLDITGDFSQTLWPEDPPLSRSDTQTISRCAFMTCLCASMAFPPLLFSQLSNFTWCPISCLDPTHKDPQNHFSGLLGLCVLLFGWWLHSPLLHFLLLPVLLQVRDISAQPAALQSVLPGGWSGLMKHPPPEWR